MTGSTLRRTLTELQKYTHVPLFFLMGRAEQGGYECLCTTALYWMAPAILWACTQIECVLLVQWQATQAKKSVLDYDQLFFK